MIKLASTVHKGPAPKKLKEYPELKPGTTFIATDGVTVVLILPDLKAINITAAWPDVRAISSFDLTYLPCEVELQVIK